ncbi:MAG TPA: 2Fe-2S iron-sulfur cluster binding domain-containing protein [Streptosporangiaceae bacterium]|jgi:ferredoxin-NADP reductase/ferredoxin
MRITVLSADRPAAGRPAGGPSGAGPSGAGRASVECDRGETVLSALTRQGIGLPSACQAGVCRACLLRVLQGDPGPAGVAGLEDSLRSDGYVLACQARPAADLTVALAGGDIYTTARLLSVRRDGPARRVRVWPDQPLAFRPGQHVALRFPAAGGEGTDLVRVYSFANRPAEADRDGLEFYVRAYPGGAMSEWLAGARPRDQLSLGRPSGTCCYQPGEPDAPLLLAGTGTGAAPLAAVAREALAAGHRGPIVLLRGAAEPGGVYPDEYLPPAPVRTRTCVLTRGGDIVAAAEAEYARLTTAAGARAAHVYLCGGPGVVARMRRAIFLAGQPLPRIHCDTFSPAITGDP